jgi:hypothetical protein
MVLALNALIDVTGQAMATANHAPLVVFMLLAG